MTFNEKMAGILHSPLIWLLATLLAYRLALVIQRQLRFHPLAHPVAVATVLLVAVLAMARVDYATYFKGAQAIHWLLGPATVALALPLYKHFPTIKQKWKVFALATLVGCGTAAATGLAMARLFNLPRETALALATKSVTMPVALGITEQLGGINSLTAAFVMLTGILGAGLAPALANATVGKSAETTGFALGLIAHGIGTSRALQESQEMGAYAGLAMGLAAICMAPLVPPLLKLWGY